MAFPTASEIAQLGRSAQMNSPLANIGRIVAGGLQGYNQAQERRDKKQASVSAKENQVKSAALLKQAVENPEQSEDLFLQAYQADPEFVTGFMQANKIKSEGMGQKDSKPFQQGQGGLVFDPNTGKYSIDPIAKDALTQKAAQAAAEGKKLGVKDIQGINKDVTALTGGVTDIVNSAKSLEALKESSSPAAKLAAVFKFMKANDPTSVVRESEQGQVYEAQGAAKQFAGKLNSLLGQGQLSSEGFQDLVDTAYVMADSAIEASSGEIDSYLNVYGDTIPEDVKTRIKGRVPSKFKTEEQGKATSGASDLSDDDLRKALGL